MALAPEQAAFAKEIAALVHEKKFRGAAQAVSDGCNLQLRVGSDKPRDYLPPLQTYLHWLLNNKGIEEAAQLLWTPTKFDPRPKFTKQVWDLFDTASTGLIMGAASCSKCLSPREKCRMWDGSIKKAGDIAVGDLLAGDDGGSRRVVERHDGEAEMFRVVPTGGALPFECNGDHILSLICSWTRRNHGGRYGISSGYTPGKIVDVSIYEYLKWSRMKRRAYRLFLRSAPMREQPVKIPPYIYGAWLGDGTRIRADLTTPTGGMGDEWCRYWRELGFKVLDRRRGRDRNCNTWSVQSDKRGTKGSPLWPNSWFRSSVINGVKRIKPEYLINSERNRLELLAGLVDSDGTSHGGGFDIVTKWPELADDIEALGRSLGFFVSRTIRKHGIKSSGFRADYTHIFISGNTSRIPTREKKVKRTTRRGLTLGFSTLSFEIESAGRGKYAGFGIDGNHRFLLANGIVTHNSYGMGVRLFLEWIRDPESTTIRVVGPSEDHLESNLFSHLVGLHDSASLPMPGEIGSLYIGLNRRNLVSAIKGVVIPVGRVKKAGRLQGTKRVARIAEHPTFGDLTRLFIFLDEAENVPAGVWSDIDNLLSNLEQVDSIGLKIFMAYNPTNQFDEVGKRAEPQKGWAAFDIDKDFRWKSTRGWDVLRLDGEQSENVISGKIIYPGLQSRAGLERIATNAGGVNSPGYMSMGRGAYPKQSLEMSIIPAGMVPKSRGEAIWMEVPKAAGGVDMALEGSATAIFTVGKMGMATGVKRPASLEHPIGWTEMFKDLSGQVVPRWVAQVDQQILLPKGDTVAMKAAVVDLARRAGIRPEHLCLDRTGNGAGVHDLIKNEWSGSVIGVNYSQSPTDRRIMVEDEKVCKDEFNRIDSELWHALRSWLEFGVLLINPTMDLSKLMPQLTRRLVDRNRKIESKKDYKSRGYESPDEADSITLFVHAARIGEAITPSMRGGGNIDSSGEDWFEGNYYEHGVRIDPSNESDFLLE